MISLVLVYWCRQAAAEAAIWSLVQHYGGTDLEVIVVDDGSPEPFVCPKTHRLNVRVVRLPTKAGPLSPCVPWNRGVEESGGDLIALSGAEIIHTTPVLGGLRATLLSGLDYVSAAVWCPQQVSWHVHSSLSKPPLNFLMLMRRELFDRVGGFDEEYREGWAFEDADFSMKLQNAGARYVIRDDLVVEHARRTDARTKYTPEQHERNRLLFESRYGDEYRAR